MDLGEQAADRARQEETSFQGTTLRGLLLEAYAFWKFGQIALNGAIASFILAGVMAVLVLLGLWHARRTSEEAEILAAPEKQTVPV